jgi:hypothetical protein
MRYRAHCAAIAEHSLSQGRARVTIDRILLALGACLAVVAIQAQVSAPGGGESRLPKGIRGLADGQAIIDQN